MSDGQWFDGARFGMFVHWGHVAQQGWELSWPMTAPPGMLPHSPSVSVEEYYAGARKFSPTPGAAREWAALARQAGMRYVVLTTKHHDGFALWPSAHGGFSIADTPYGDDLVREFVDAVRAEGLRVGLYFSLCDWHHPDYPAFTEASRPYLFTMYPRPDPAAWQRFVDDVLFAQLRELLTAYGPIDLVWFDGGWERTAQEWRAGELEAMMRELQPGLVINDRLPGVGDYLTPEQLVPAEAPGPRWETCMTMNRTWGYCPADTEYKPARDLLHTLCETAGRGGNLLLNIGPDAHGAVPPEQVERLRAVGSWMQRHAAAIHDTTAGVAPWQFYGPSTRAGDRLHLFLLMRPYDTVSLRGVPVRRIRRVRDLGTGTELDWTHRCAALDELINSDPIGEAVIRVPAAVVDDLATVLEVTIDPS